MPTQVDTPIATGARSDWARWGSASSKVAAVSTNDGDTSIVYASTGGKLFVDDYQFPPITGVADPVSAASITSVARKYLQGAGGQDYHHRWNSSPVAPDRWVEVRLAFPNYKTVTHNASGNQLSLSRVNGEHGIQFVAAGGPTQKAELWVTHLYRTVTYTYDAGSAGEFAHLIGSLVGALLGSGLLLSQVGRISTLMWERGRIRLNPDEYELAFEAWKNYRHPVWSVR